MKYAFSTNGWKGLRFEDCFTMARELHFDGIELHDLLQPSFCGEGEAFSREHIRHTARKLADKKISVPCLDTVCNIANAAAKDAAVKEILYYIEAAAALKCPCVRIHGAACADANQEDEAVKALIAAVLPQARQAKITLLVETCGIYADTKRLCSVLNSFADDFVAALWDMNHPYRFAGEDPETTIQNLGAYVKHVHIKDSLLENGEIRYCLMGQGDLPIDQMLHALQCVNYAGFLSFECVPSWLDPALSGAEIVFPHFISYMGTFHLEGVRETKLYFNKAHTGKYVWEKDVLIEKTFSQVLDTMAENFPDQCAICYTTLDYTRTYAQFRDDVDTFARSLITLGVKAGDHVAVWATNVPQWYIAFWAATKIGAVLVTMNTAYKIAEAEYLLRQSDTHTLILIEGYRDSDYAGIIGELCPELETAAPGQPLHCRKLPFLRNIITVSYRHKGCISWEDALALAAKTPKEEVARRAAAVSVHDVANMQYTSGTTGFPKGVMLTHHNIVNNGKCIGDRMDLSTADRMMIQVPMFHCFGMVLAMTASMTHGTTIYPLPYFSPRPSLACIHQEHITCFHGVPTMFIAMLEHPDFAKTDFSYMRTGIMAGSPCPISKMRDVVEKMNMKEIVIVFGQTEASPGCTMSSTDDTLETRVGTVGRALPNIECRIVDPETGVELPVGQTGEFVARGYNIMKGYYKMPKATKSAIDSEGWLHTGDLACKTEDGNYRVTGRLKDMIIRGGENIYPKEIEEFIFTYPKVKDVQVVGVPDEQYGEEILAVVVLKEGETATEDEIKQYVRDHMARHKVPRYVDFVKEFPMNAAGKILKYKMREQAVEKLKLQKASSIETA